MANHQEFIDLHTHSTCSDGSLSPEGLVIEAAKAGLAAIALTDHDTIAGIAEFLAAGKSGGLEVLGGVEVSATHEGKPVHILGYGMDITDHGLISMLDHLQEIRKTRNEAIIEKLATLGINIDRAELAATASGLIGRPHIARLLVKQGVVSSIDQAFRKYLGNKGRAYVAAARYSAEDTICSITQAGGLAVLAHPTTFDKSINRVAKMVKELKDIGLAGIEAYYPGHSTKVLKKLLAVAEADDLLVTGGSDFHGPVKPGINIGGTPVMPPVPYCCLTKLKERLTNND
ncbi:MAG: PHP domain-containing protein [Thermodesulfobacteriota bacterium]